MPRVAQLELVLVEVGPEKIGRRPWQSDVSVAPNDGGHDTTRSAGQRHYFAFENNQRGFEGREETKEKPKQGAETQHTGAAGAVACADAVGIGTTKKRQTLFETSKSNGKKKRTWCGLSSVFC